MPYYKYVADRGASEYAEQALTRVCEVYIGNKDYRLTARHNTGTFLAADGVTEVETKAVTGVAEYVYGSTRYDVSGGVEQYETGGNTADRWFTSAGVTTKRGVWSLTAEGLYGQVEGQDETSAFLGEGFR